MTSTWWESDQAKHGGGPTIAHVPSPPCGPGGTGRRVSPREREKRLHERPGFLLARLTLSRSEDATRSVSAREDERTRPIVHGHPTHLRHRGATTSPRVSIPLRPTGARRFDEITVRLKTPRGCLTLHRLSEMLTVSGCATGASAASKAHYPTRWTRRGQHQRSKSGARAWYHGGTERIGWRRDSGGTTQCPGQT